MATYKPMPPGGVAITMGKKDRMHWGIQPGATAKSVLSHVRLEGEAVRQNITTFGKLGPFGQAMDQLRVSLALWGVKPVRVFSRQACCPVQLGHCNGCRRPKCGLREIRWRCAVCAHI